MAKENQQSINENQKNNYDNRRSYDNTPLKKGECLIPIHVTWDMVKHFNINRENIETWHFSNQKVLVAFSPVSISNKENAMKCFWKDVRDYIASLKVTDTLSYDQFLEDSESEENKGFDPGQTGSLENTALLSLIIDDLIRDVTQMNPRYGHILELLKQDYTKGEILDVLLPEYDLKKTQGYAEIKAAQKLAKALYYQD